MGIFELIRQVVSMVKKKQIWEEFGLSEEKLTKILKEIRHTEIDSEGLIDFCKQVFPNSKEDQVRGFFLVQVASEWSPKDDD